MNSGVKSGTWKYAFALFYERRVLRREGEIYVRAGRSSRPSDRISAGREVMLGSERKRESMKGTIARAGWRRNTQLVAGGFFSPRIMRIAPST